MDLSVGQEPNREDEEQPRGSTAPQRSRSNIAKLRRRMSRFVADSPTTAQWSPEGFIPDLKLLGQVLAMASRVGIRSGEVPAALDIWAAAMLRQAGIGDVIPQPTEPYYVSRIAATHQSSFQRVDDALLQLRQAQQSLGRFAQVRPPARAIRDAIKTLTGEIRSLRKGVEEPKTKVLGESRKKQTDVFMAEWDRGLELLISTKTIAVAVDDEGDLIKNLQNRWEEFDGDLKNLRGRFPMAVIGALVLLPRTTLGTSTRGSTITAFVDMMTKLIAPGREWVNAYDATCLLIADFENATADEVPIVNLSIPRDTLPYMLQPTTFFNTLISKLFDRAPITEHTDARARALEARGEDAATLRAAAQAEKAVEGQAAGEPES